MRIMRKTQSQKSISQFKLCTDRRKDEAALEELLDSTNFHYLFKAIHIHDFLDHLETETCPNSLQFGCNSSGSTFQ